MSTKTLPVEPQLKNAVVIAREKIRAGSQPREYFDPAQMQDLRESIKEHGLLQPLVVRYEPSRYDNTPYILIAGERRFKASEGILDALPCILQDVGAASAQVLTLIENLQRADLTEIEEARGIRNLMQEQNLSANAAAKALKKSPGWVNNRLALLKTQPDVQEVAARVPLAMSSLLLIDGVKDNEFRSELLEQVENHNAPYTQIKTRIEERERDEQWRKESQKPDVFTSARLVEIDRSGGITTGRSGAIVKGTDSREAFDAAHDALTRASGSLDSALSWWPSLTDSQRAKLQPLLAELALKIEPKL